MYGEPLEVGAARAVIGGRGGSAVDALKDAAQVLRSLGPLNDLPGRWAPLETSFKTYQLATSSSLTFEVVVTLEWRVDA